MNIEHYKNLIVEVSSNKVMHGFDEFKFRLLEKESLGIRVANNAICRENVLSHHHEVTFQGCKNKKASSFSTSIINHKNLLNKIEILANDIDSQSPDLEYASPDPKKGTTNCIMTKHDLFEIFKPEEIYKILNKHIEPIRRKELRVTGFVEASKENNHIWFNKDSYFNTQDLGIEFTFTVDNIKTGATGVGKGSLISSQADVLEKSISSCLQEAEKICLLSENTAEIEPGDYPVILSASSMFNLIVMSLFYGLFDKRKIDEKRTYLGKNLNNLSFHPDLILSIQKNLNVDSINYEPLAVNENFTICENLKLIEQGTFKDFIVNRFWAKTNNLQETFDVGDGIISLNSSGDSLATFSNLDDMIANTEKGIFINDTWYLRMVSEMDGTLTGMTRDGLFLVENGKITKPLKNMRWHENPFKVLSNISAMTAQKSLFGRSKIAGSGRNPLAYIPAVKVDHFHFSSVTKF